MPEFTPRQLQAAVGDLIGKMMAQGEQADADIALGWCVVTFDPEMRGAESITVFGDWDDPVEALAWAETHDAGCNSGLGEDELPYYSVVLPRMPHAV